MTKAYLGNNGWLHIITADGRDNTIQPQKWQAGGGFADVAIAPDRKTVGWLVNQRLIPEEGGTSYSYNASLELDIWRDGGVIRRLSLAGPPIQNWVFLKGGAEVSFDVAPPHFWNDYTSVLFDVNTGRRLATWSIDRPNYIVPDWAKPLVQDEILPSPNEVREEIRNSSPPAKSVSSRQAVSDEH